MRIAPKQTLTRIIPIILLPDWSQTNAPLVNKWFIIWLSGKFFLRDTAGSPERAIWLHLARSGSQSHRAIWVILPAREASHIIKRYLVVYDLVVNVAVLELEGFQKFPNGIWTLL